MSAPASCPPESLQLWFSRLSDASREAEQAVSALLSDSERARLAAIGNPRRRREYLLSRALMRHALSSSFSSEESKWIFTDTGDGLPTIDNLPGGIYLSLSHSRGLIAFAICPAAIGIDLEAIDPKRDFGSLAEAFMSAGEISALPPGNDARVDYFYRLWCAKEAAYKSLAGPGQSAARLVDIDYSELCSGAMGSHLVEARSERYCFAAVTGIQPESVICNHFLHAANSLTRAIGRGASREPKKSA